MQAVIRKPFLVGVPVWYKKKKDSFVCISGRPICFSFFNIAWVLFLLVFCNGYTYFQVQIKRVPMKYNRNRLFLLITCK